MFARIFNCLYSKVLKIICKPDSLVMKISEKIVKNNIIQNLFLKSNMNEYLEQLVRVLTNAYSRSQKMFGERVSPGPANQRSFPGLPCCWGQLLIKRHPWIHLTDYALSLSLSACFYALASWCPSQRTRDNSKRRGLIACVLIKQHQR